MTMSWHKYSRRFILILLVGVLVGQSAVWGQQPTSGGTLTVGLAADIAHFDVFHILGYEAIWALTNIHSGLVRINAQGEIVPGYGAVLGRQGRRTHLYLSPAPGHPLP
jgi:ABC-type transport system substrate-binding protein